MFCPEGYVSLFETESEFGALAKEWWNKQSAAYREGMLSEVEAKRKAEILQIPDVFWGENVFIDATPYVAYSRWALMIFVISYQKRLFAASPDGRIVKIGAAAFDATRSYFGSFPTSLAEQDSMVDHLEDGFFHLENEYFTIRPCAKTDIIELFGFQTIVSILKHFDGWSVCWKPRNPADWLPEVRAILGDELRAMLDDEMTPLPVHRHSLSDERRAATLMVAMYDEDDQVTKATCQERAGRNLGTLAFGRAWEAAKAERPGLGLGGRPKSKPQT